MMFPGMMSKQQEKPKQLIPESWKLPLRVAGFAAAVFAIIKYGDQMEMPEAPRV
jgi:hypothetical protein